MTRVTTTTSTKKLVVGLLAGVAMLTSVVRVELGTASIVSPTLLLVVMSIVAPLSAFAAARLWPRQSAVLTSLLWLSLFLVFRLGYGGALSVAELPTLLLELAWLSAVIGLARTLYSSEIHHEQPSNADEFASPAEIERCMMHCRRHSRPLSVVVVPLGISQTADRTPDATKLSKVSESELKRSVSRVIGGSLRRTDLLARPDRDGVLLIICPDLGPGDRSSTLERIETEVAANLGLSVKCGFASFPEEALTLAQLVATARERSPRVGRAREVRHDGRPVLNSAD